MGLDNGVICKNIKREDVPTWVDLPWGWDEEHEDVELIYFRKHWGIRGEILKKIHCMDDNESHTPVEAEDIIPIVKILMKYLDKEYYEYNADSIWEYAEACNHIQHSIINLIWLKTYMESHPDVECYFYDSW